MILPVRAPSAFFRPISRIRSPTAMIIVFTTDSPPITSASRAAPSATAVKVVPVALKLATRSLGFWAWTPGTCPLMSAAIASMAARLEPLLA